MDRNELDRERQPVLMVVVGRQRVGKTSFLNAVAQFLRAHGATFQVWDADKMNTSYNMSIFHHDALQPPSEDPEDVKAWLEERFVDLVDHRFDAVLDVGGGDTPLARLVQDVPVVATLEEEGVRVVLLHVIGPELADLDYLERFEANDLFSPEATLIVMNGGLVLTGRSSDFAFSQVYAHDTVLEAIANGATVVRMPRLSCMSEVTDRGLSFDAAMNGRPGIDGRPLALFDRTRVRKWWERELPAMFDKIPTEWLPQMGKSAPERPTPPTKKARKGEKVAEPASDESQTLG